MTDSDDEKLSGYKLATHAVRAGQIRSQEGEHAEPIFLTSSFVFKDAAEAAARFSGEEAGNIYSRFHQPDSNAPLRNVLPLWKVQTAVLLRLPA